MILIIVRHGKTIENEKGIIHGVKPGKLSIKGIEQAKIIAKRLENRKIDTIYSSNLRRAKETATIIAKNHKCPLIFTKELIERNYGILEGKPKENAKKIIDYPYKIPKGESLDKLRKRAEMFLRRIRKKHANDTVLLIGHNRINLAMIAVIKNMPAEYIYEQRKQRHEEIKIIKVK